MTSTSSRERDAAKRDKKAHELRTYTKPTLLKLGSVTSLTTGGSGNLGDITGPTTPGNKQW